MENDLKFSLIKKENLSDAVGLALEIFPYEVSFEGFLPELEYKLSLTPERKGMQQFFIVSLGDELVGITGYNFHYTKPKSTELWLGYFGVREKFRGHGLGKKILHQTLDLANFFNPNLRVMKLYTSNRPEEKGSHHLYKCLGFRIYAHRNTKPFHTYYFRL